MTRFNLRIESLVIESASNGIRRRETSASFNLRIESLVIERASPSPCQVRDFRVSISELRVLLLREENKWVKIIRCLSFNLRIESLVIERGSIPHRRTPIVYVSISELRVLLLRGRMSLIVIPVDKPSFNLRIESLVIERGSTSN